MGKSRSLQERDGRSEGRGQGIEDWKDSSGRTILTSSRGRKNRREKRQSKVKLSP
jgi:hypothetical protein